MPLPIVPILIGAGLAAKIGSDIYKQKKTQDFQEDTQKAEAQEQRRKERKAALERAMTGKRSGAPAFSLSQPYKPPEIPDMTAPAAVGGLGEIVSVLAGRYGK